MARIIVIAGGIGCGKSVVSRVVESMGYRVYDCDSRAKKIMDHDTGIKREISEKVSGQALLDDMSLDRKHIADVVFSDRSKLAILNGIVHGAVRRDIAGWVCRHCREDLLFVETAIPKSSGLVEMADVIWLVESPCEVRIARVCKRDSLDAESVKRRIEAQKGETEISGENVTAINNDGRHSILLQINKALAEAQAWTES